MEQLLLHLAAASHGKYTVDLISLQDIKNTCLCLENKVFSLYAEMIRFSGGVLLLTRLSNKLWCNLVRLREDWSTLHTTIQHLLQSHIVENGLNNIVMSKLAEQKKTVSIFSTTSISSRFTIRLKFQWTNSSMLTLALLWLIIWLFMSSIGALGSSTFTGWKSVTLKICKEFKLSPEPTSIKLMFCSTGIKLNLKKD